MEKVSQQELLMVNGGGLLQLLLSSPLFYDLVGTLLRKGFNYALQAYRKRLAKKYRWS